MCVNLLRQRELAQHHTNTMSQPDDNKQQGTPARRGLRAPGEAAAASTPRGGLQTPSRLARQTAQPLAPNVSPPQTGTPARQAPPRAATFAGGRRTPLAGSARPSLGREGRPSLGASSRPSLGGREGRIGRPSLGATARPSLGRDARPSMGRDGRPSIGRDARASVGRDARPVPVLKRDARASTGRAPARDARTPGRDGRPSMGRQGAPDHRQSFGGGGRKPLPRGDTAPKMVPRTPNAKTMTPSAMRQAAARKRKEAIDAMEQERRESNMANKHGGRSAARNAGYAAGRSPPERGGTAARGRSPPGRSPAVRGGPAARSPAVRGGPAARSPAVRAGPAAHAGRMSPVRDARRVTGGTPATRAAARRRASGGSNALARPAAPVSRRLVLGDAAKEVRDGRSRAEAMNEIAMQTDGSAKMVVPDAGAKPAGSALDSFRAVRRASLEPAAAAAEREVVEAASAEMSPEGAAAAGLAAVGVAGIAAAGVAAAGTASAPIPAASFADRPDPSGALGAAFADRPDPSGALGGGIGPRKPLVATNIIGTGSQSAKAAVRKRGKRFSERFSDANIDLSNVEELRRSIGPRWTSKERGADCKLPTPTLTYYSRDKKAKEKREREEAERKAEVERLKQDFLKQAEADKLAKEMGGMSIGTSAGTEGRRPLASVLADEASNVPKARMSLTKSPDLPFNIDDTAMNWVPKSDEDMIDK